MKNHAVLAAVLLGALTLPGLAPSAMKSGDSGRENRSEEVGTGTRQADWKGQGDIYRGERAAYTAGEEA